MFTSQVSFSSPSKGLPHHQKARQVFVPPFSPPDQFPSTPSLPVIPYLLRFSRCLDAMFVGGPRHTSSPSHIFGARTLLPACPSESMEYWCQSGTNWSGMPGTSENQCGKTPPDLPRWWFDSNIFLCSPQTLGKKKSNLTI